MMNFKAVLNYCFRVLVFLLLTRRCISEHFINILGPILIFPSNYIGGENGIILGFILLLFLPFYIYPKICGLFKKLDKLNIIFASMVILIIDILFSFSRALTVQLTPLKFSFGKPDIAFLMIWFFFIYRFLNLLTKIFPMPFKQIGYIFSTELFKDIYKDIVKDIKENYLKK